jgi:glycosyltransferase involved in cell wall biosynthesis
MKERELSGYFGDTYSTHYGEANYFNVFKSVVVGAAQFVRYLPHILKLRSQYKKRLPWAQSKRPLRVGIFADTLDEVNGISNSSRILVQYMREEQKRNVSLVGVVGHRENRGKMEKNGTLLIPQIFSMPLFGYPDSELNVPSLKEILPRLKKQPIDLLELETPLLGGVFAMVLAKMIGIPVVSQYRTDALGYAKLLTGSHFQYLFTKYWTTIFLHAASPVVVPSQAFKKKLMEDMEIREHNIVILKRGVKITSFSPEFRSQNHWQNFFPGSSKDTDKRSIRFLFVGRVSQDKALPFLESVWRQLRKTNPNIELLIVGHGPYSKPMQENMSDCPEVKFAGRQSGMPLASLYAESDFLFFPSGMDTFGNVIVESLASGTPVLVSDQGGPVEIISDGKSGWSMEFQNQSEWLEALEKACDIFQNEPEKYQQWRKDARSRAEEFSLKNAGNDLWKFWQDTLRAQSC